MAAVTLSAAAALVAMAARYSDDLPDAAAIADTADELRERSAAAAADDASAYAAVLAAYRLDRDDPARGDEIAAALGRAADVPAALVTCARDVAALGARLAGEGNPNLRGDAVTAVLLAEAAARSAANLVRINVELGGLDGNLVAQTAAQLQELAGAARAVDPAA